MEKIEYNVEDIRIYFYDENGECVGEASLHQIVNYYIENVLLK